MKAMLLSTALQKKLPFLLHAISSRSELPILLNFLIEAKNETLRISATDLEIGITTILPAMIQEEGETTVPAKIFAELIASIGTEELVFSSDEKSLQVRGKNVHASFQTIDPNDFPKLYEEKGTEKLHEKREILHNTLASVVFASAIDTGRPALSGILLKKNSGESGILFVATDGYRLSLKTQAHEAKEEGEEQSVLIPARVIREFLAMKEGETVGVFISRKNNQILFSSGDSVLVGRLIDAEYPNYERIIPNEFATRAIFDKEDMQKAVKICSIFARDTANIIKFSLKNPSASSGQGKITISANTPAVGENSVDVDAQISGEENEIAFNSRYLLDLFSNMTAETLAFEMNGPLNPGVFKIENDVSFLHIIMPIRVQA